MPRLCCGAASQSWAESRKKPQKKPTTTYKAADPQSVSGNRGQEVSMLDSVPSSRWLLLAAAAVPAVSGFSVPSLPSGAVRSPSASLSLRMQSEGADRRGFLAGLLAVPLAAAVPSEASAQLPFLGDPKGERPSGLGPAAGGRFLSLCDSENCVSTSEDVYSKRYLPPWAYNPEGEKKKSTATAKAELLAVVKEQPGAKIIKDTDTYIYAEFERELGLVDDVEFLFSPNGETVEYRSAARKKKKSDHRARIRTIRLALAPKGWKSVGYRCLSYSYNSMGDQLCEKKEAPKQLTREESRII